MMTTHYESAFEELRAEISVYSPSAVRILEQIQNACGVQTAYYAAFVLICLKAQQELPVAKPLDTITSADLKDYTFFEVAKGNQMAISLFDEALLGYRTEQNIRKAREDGHATGNV
jgi:hypothetical protein